MAHKKYFDITKVNGVTPEIIREYKKIARRERYIEELDNQHIVYRYGSDEEIYPLFNVELNPEINTEKERKIRLLYKALNMLYKADEINYMVTMDYFFACDKTSYSILAQKYGVSKQTIYNKIQRSIIFLRGAMIELNKNSNKN